MRQSVVENKYNLTISKIRQLQVADRSKVNRPMFWRNNVVNAWCISDSVGPDYDATEYWIGIYDEDAKEYAGQFKFNFATYGGMCGYDFEEFFKKRDIEHESDFVIQEKFLKKINELIDAGILSIGGL